MKDELQSVSSLGLPATVYQTGEKNIHIDKANTVNQNITINFPYMQRSPTGGIQPTSRTINTNCYHLFVMGGETFEQDHFLIPPDRALSSYWTSEDLREKYGRLDDASIQEIKAFPALFMQEAQDYYAKASEEQQAFFGFVDSIRKQENGVKVRCQLLWPIPMNQICGIGFELGMKDMTRAITELNHTHWAIKHIHLIEELKDAKITLFGVA